MSVVDPPLVPDGLRDLMNSFTKEILREKPYNIYEYSALYFESRINEETDFTTKGYEPTSGYEQFFKNRERNKIPFSLVYTIFPERLTELIKQFIKTVLRENPTNICKFAVEYFRKLGKLEDSKPWALQYNAYENYLKTNHYLKCTCGRTLENDLMAGYVHYPGKTTNNTNANSMRKNESILSSDYQHLKLQEISGSTNTVESAYELVIVPNPSTAALNFSNEKHLKAIQVLQRFFRRCLKKKTDYLEADTTLQTTFNSKMSEKTAALIIQRTLLKLFNRQDQKNPAVPHSENIDLKEGANDNISEPGSYSSESTVLMSAERDFGIVVCEEEFLQKTIIMEEEEKQNEYHSNSKEPTSSIHYLINDTSVPPKNVDTKIVNDETEMNPKETNKSNEHISDSTTINGKLHIFMETGGLDKPSEEIRDFMSSNAQISDSTDAFQVSNHNAEIIQEPENNTDEATEEKQLLNNKAEFTSEKNNISTEHRSELAISNSSDEIKMVLDVFNEILHNTLEETANPNVVMPSSNSAELISDSRNYSSILSNENWTDQNARNNPSKHIPEKNNKLNTNGSSLKNSSNQSKSISKSKPKVIEMNSVQKTADTMRNIVTDLVEFIPQGNQHSSNLTTVHHHLGVSDEYSTKQRDYAAEYIPEINYEPRKNIYINNEPDTFPKSNQHSPDLKKVTHNTDNLASKKKNQLKEHSSDLMTDNDRSKSISESGTQSCDGNVKHNQTDCITDIISDISDKLNDQILSLTPVSDQNKSLFQSENKSDELKSAYKLETHAIELTREPIELKPKSKEVYDEIDCTPDDISETSDPRSNSNVVHEELEHIAVISTNSDNINVELTMENDSTNSLSPTHIKVEEYVYDLIPINDKSFPIGYPNTNGDNSDLIRENEHISLTSGDYNNCNEQSFDFRSVNDERKAILDLCSDSEEIEVVPEQTEFMLKREYKSYEKNLNLTPVRNKAKSISESGNNSDENNSKHTLEFYSNESNQEIVENKLSQIVVGIDRIEFIQEENSKANKPTSNLNMHQEQVEYNEPSNSNKINVESTIDTTISLIETNIKVEDNRFDLMPINSDLRTRIQHTGETSQEYINSNEHNSKLTSVCYQSNSIIDSGSDINKVINDQVEFIIENSFKPIEQNGGLKSISYQANSITASGNYSDEIGSNVKLGTLTYELTQETVQNRMEPKVVYGEIETMLEAIDLRSDLNVVHEQVESIEVTNSDKINGEATMGNDPTKSIAETNNKLEKYISNLMPINDQAESIPSGSSKSTEGNSKLKKENDRGRSTSEESNNSNIHSSELVSTTDQTKAILDSVSGSEEIKMVTEQTECIIEADYTSNEQSLTAVKSPENIPNLSLVTDNNTEKNTAQFIMGYYPTKSIAETNNKAKESTHELVPINEKTESVPLAIEHGFHSIKVNSDQDLSTETSDNSNETGAKLIPVRDCPKSISESSGSSYDIELKDINYIAESDKERNEKSCETHLALTEIVDQTKSKNNSDEMATEPKLCSHSNEPISGTIENKTGQKAVNDGIKYNSKENFQSSDDSSNLAVVPEQIKSNELTGTNLDKIDKKLYLGNNQSELILEKSYKSIDNANEKMPINNKGEKIFKIYETSKEAESNSEKHDDQLEPTSEENNKSNIHSSDLISVNIPSESYAEQKKTQNNHTECILEQYTTNKLNSVLITVSDQDKSNSAIEKNSVGINEEQEIQIYPIQNSNQIQAEQSLMNKLNFILEENNDKSIEYSTNLKAFIGDTNTNLYAMQAEQNLKGDTTESSQKIFVSKEELNMVNDEIIFIPEEIVKSTVYDLVELIELTGNKVEESSPERKFLNYTNKSILVPNFKPKDHISGEMQINQKAATIVKFNEQDCDLPTISVEKTYIIETGPVNNSSKIKMNPNMGHVKDQSIPGTKHNSAIPPNDQEKSLGEDKDEFYKDEYGFLPIDRHTNHLYPESAALHETSMEIYSPEQKDSADINVNIAETVSTIENGFNMENKCEENLIKNDYPVTQESEEMERTTCNVEKSNILHIFEGKGDSEFESDKRTFDNRKKQLGKYEKCRNGSDSNIEVSVSKNENIKISQVVKGEQNNTQEITFEDNFKMIPEAIIGTSGSNIKTVILDFIESEKRFCGSGANIEEKRAEIAEKKADLDVDFPYERLSTTGGNNCRKRYYNIKTDKCDTLLYSSDMNNGETFNAMKKQIQETDEIIGRMQQRYAGERRIAIFGEEYLKEHSFDEPDIRSMKDMYEDSSNHTADKVFVIVNDLEYEISSCSSTKSDSIIFGENDAKYTGPNDFGGTGNLISGNNPKKLFKSVTIDETVKYFEPSDSTTLISASSFDYDTVQLIRQKIMAYSLSEANSDNLETTTETLPQQKVNIDDFNISTALIDATETSTDTESTIVSASTKIQAGTRGALTRRQLLPASISTKSSTQDENKASFGNEAISESLEKFIEDEAAKKIQKAYRKVYRQKYDDPPIKPNIQKCYESKCDATTSYPSCETSLAVKRLTLQRGDALRIDSTLEEDNATNACEKLIRSNFTQPDFATELPLKNLQAGNDSESESNVDIPTTANQAKKDVDSKLRWLTMRQNSMPVQIDSEVFRVIPKHLRKRIRSAESAYKGRRNTYKD